MIHSSNKAKPKGIRTRGMRVLTLAAALCMALFCVFSSSDGAQAQSTTITVQVKGLVYDMVGGWQAVTLNSPVEVFSADGNSLGVLNSAAASLAVDGIESVVLRPSAIIEGFAFADEATYAIKQAQTNLAMIFAYAEQGFFTLENTDSDTGAPLSGAEYAVINSDGEVLLSFTVGNDGKYISEKPLPCGEYSLVEMCPPEGAEPSPTVNLSIGVYTGSDSDVTRISSQSTVTAALSPESGKSTNGSDDVVSELTPDETQAINIDESTSSILGGSVALGEGVRVVAASLTSSSEVLTDQNGSFRIDGLKADDYSVYIELPEGKTLASDSEWSPAETGDMCWYTLSLAASEEYELPEPIFTELMSIEGFAYMDLDGNGENSNGESLLTGVPVYLKRLEDGIWVDVAEQKTNEYGKFTFDMLPAGNYAVFSEISSSELYISSIGSNFETEPELGMRSAVISLQDGRSVSDAANVGLRQATAFSLSAFIDSDQNGQRNGKEKAVSGMTAELTLNGETAYSASTDENGVLSIASVKPGEYGLRLVLPVGYSVISGSIDNGSSVNLISGQPLDAAVGLAQVGSFSGKVFEDINNNGIMDEDEPGASGVTLKLRGSKSGKEYELITDDSGIYVFTSLPDDAYSFTAELPEGMLLARYSKDGGDLRSVFTGETTTREYAIKGAQHVSSKNVGVIKRGIVEGTAFLDLNYNGLRDENEPGFAGVSLELIKISGNDIVGRAVSDENGFYSFDNLRLGDYRLRAILPIGGSIFTKVGSGENANLFEQRESRRENYIQPVTVISGSTTQTLVGVAVSASISGTVYQDEDYNGAFSSSEKTFSGLNVRLIDSDGNEAASVVSAAGGSYEITGIMPGVYTLEVARKPKYGFTRLRPQETEGNHIVELKGEYGVTAPMTIAMGDVLENINAGMLPSATVSGMLFEDLNDNGMRDESEFGMTDATVRLVSEDGEIDLVREVSQTGEYFFDGVMPGKYTITFMLPAHSEIAITASGGNTLVNQGQNTTTSAFNVTMGDNFAYPLVGAVRLGSFDGFTFHDVNANGIQDADEERMPGVEIALIPSRSDLSAKNAVSGFDGSYSITDLRPSDYSLEVTLPSGYIVSRELSSESISLAAAEHQTIACPWQALISREVKPIGAVHPAVISGALWLDENRDCIRGSKEALLGGVSVELVDSTTGLTAQRVQTGEGGFMFDSVRPGTYRIRFAKPPQAEPAGEPGAAFTQNGEYMVRDGVAVAESAAIDGLDVGLVCRTSLGGKVWLDEGGQSTPAVGINISLYQNGSSSPIGTVVTSESGDYRFDGLWPGEYRLEAEKPSGAVFVKPDDPNYKQGASVIISTENGRGISGTITLLMARHQLSLNIIFIKPAKVGDIAWIDTNRNGLVDAGEPRLPNVSIRLEQNGVTMYEAITDNNGYYLFEDVYPGAYTLTAVAYPQLDITNSIPSLRMISSCLTGGNGDLAFSDEFEVVSGSVNKDFDLGYVLREGQSMPELPSPDIRDWTGVNTKELPRY